MESVDLGLLRKAISVPSTHLPCITSACVHLRCSGLSHRNPISVQFDQHRFDSDATFHLKVVLCFSLDYEKKP